MSSRFADTRVLLAWLIVSTDYAVRAHIVDSAKVVHLPTLAAVANLDIDGVVAHDVVLGVAFAGHLTRASMAEAMSSLASSKAR